MKNLEAEDVWLRFFLRRLRLGLRNAKSADTTAVLEELIKMQKSDWTILNVPPVSAG
jgi:hypothetical protein